MKKAIIIFTVFILNISNAQITDFKDIDFTKADNIAKLNKDEDLENLSLLSYKLTHKLPTKVEKFRAIYVWVCNNISGDSKQESKITHNRNKLKKDSILLLKWNNEYKKKTFKKLLKSKKTMCTGYAYLIKELAFLAGIECEIIDGYGRTVNANIDTLETINHSWNAVKLNDKWYLCDATWSSGYLNDNKSFVKDFNEGYFLASPKLFAQNHFPINKKWLLKNSTTKNSFISAPLVYGEALKHKIIPLTPSKMNIEIKKNEEISFSFKTLKNIDLKKVSLVYFIGIPEQKFPIYDIKSENGIITFKNKFKWKGVYDAHLKIGSDIVATYSIKITKI